MDSYMSLNLLFYFDYITNLFLLIVSLIRMATFLYRKSYIDSDKNQNKFVVLIFLFVISIFIVVIRYNFFIILVGWDCLGVVSYFLVIHYYSDNRDYSGIVTLMTNRLGDVAIIFCLYLSLSFITIDFFIIKREQVMFSLFVFLFSVCGFTKRAQYPFRVWLPLAIAAPTPISALVHSSTLVTAGVYLFIRFEFIFKFSDLFVTLLILLIGLTIVVASLGALFDLDIKKIVAYSTLSQLGLIIISVVIGDEIFSFFHILTHALFKALLFFCSGIFIHRCFDNQDIRCFGYNLKLDILVVVVFFICSLSLAGFPFLRGFYSKDLILEIVYLNNFNLFYVLLLIVNTLITGIYSLRLIYYAMLIAKKNIKLVLSSDWLLISNRMFYLFLGVIFSGRIIYWLLLLKFDLIFLPSLVKLLNFLLVPLFFILFLMFYKDRLKYFVSSYTSYFLSMFFLKNFQGFLVNSLYKNSLLFRFYLEFLNEFILFSNFYNYFKNQRFLINFFKLFMIYFCVLFIIVLIIFF